MKKRLFRALALLCALATAATGANALSVEEARELLQRSYVDTLPRAADEAQTLEELFSFTDDYTYYMDEAEYEAFLRAVEGEESFIGIGAEIVYTEEGIELSAILSGGGAERAGLRAGEVIVRIDGEDCVPGSEEARERLLGEEGTTVLLRVRGLDGAEREVRVTRTLVRIENTSVTAENGVGCIDCNSFGSRTGELFRAGVLQNDKSVRTWIVDLRGNTGGLTNAAAAALGTFSGAGTYVYLVNRYGSIGTERYDGADYSDKPVIVLTDGVSASASEIFAQGILATGTGIVVGTRSFGKGVAQVLYDEESCPYLSGDAVKLTAYRFYCAGRTTTDRIGVLPTLYVPMNCAAAAAELLAGEKRTDGGEYLHLVLNGCDFYVDPATEERTALQCVLLALGPTTELYWGEGGQETRISAAEAREKCGFAARGLGFADVSGHEYEEEIDTLAASRIVLGDGESFRPDETMTRAEVCALLAQALNLAPTGESAFSDVDAAAWYAPAVDAMAALELVSGVGGGRFAPDETMSKEEFITVLGRVMEFLSLDAQDYLDENPLAILRLLPEYEEFSSWAVRAAALVTQSVTDENGEAVSLFCEELAECAPREAITRGEAAASLCRVLRAVGALTD